MKPDERSIVDERLAALKSALGRVSAPPLKLETVIAEPAAEAPVQEPPPVPSNRRLALPAILGIAASVAVAALVFMRPWSVVESTPAPVPASMASLASVQGDYLAAPVRVPIAVQSVTRGPELHYLDAQIVRDRHGNTRVVFVGSIREE